VMTKPGYSMTRYYLGDYEEEVTGTSTRKIHYVSGGDGLAALYVQNNGQDSLYFAFSDFQGNLIALAKADGSVAEKYAYDPWGNRRNPYDWQQVDTCTAFITHRGYTLHEHLDDFNLINMNGRMYDPRLGMFLSPDPYIQAPGDWLNYNRYSYCLNNPLMYTDPSGEFIHLIIGAAIGGLMNWAFNGGQFNAKGLDYFGVGALAGALGAGIGAIMPGGVGSFGAGFIGAQTAIMAPSSFLTGAAMWGAAGFGSGFATGFGNSFVSGNSFNKSLGQGALGGLIGGASGALLGGIMGGIDAVNNGRTFWRGGEISIERLAIDASFLDIPLNEQMGNYGCVDNFIDNVSTSAYIDVCGNDVRYAIDPNSSPFTEGLNDVKAMEKYTEMIGGDLRAVKITKNNMDDLYHAIGRDKIGISYSLGKMNHQVNVYGAYRQVITYPGGSINSEIMYNVIDNGTRVVRSASSFLSNYSHFFRIILP